MFKTNISHYPRILASIAMMLLLSTGNFLQKISGQVSFPKEAKVVPLPYDRLLSPAGKLIVFGDSLKESHAMDGALKPGGEWLAVLERYSIVMIDTKTNQVNYVIRLDSIPGLRGTMTVYSGIQWFQQEGMDYFCFSAVNPYGKSFVVVLSWDGKTATLFRRYEYKAIEPAALALPNEVLVNREECNPVMYVVLNGNNELIKQDLITGDTIWKLRTSVAPYGIALASNKIYLTNWAGRTPMDNDPNVAGVPWGKARIDTSNAATREGSVSVIDPAFGTLLKEIKTGLHPSDIIASPDGQYIYLTSSNSDAVDVIHTSRDEITETISLRLQAESNPYFGDSPNGLACTADGNTLFVANGMDNAVAMITLGKDASASGKEALSKLNGFIPTGAYPSSVSIKDNQTLYVTNLESMGASSPFKLNPRHAPIFNSHHMLASVSVIGIPGKKELERHTQTVIALNQLERLRYLQQKPRANISPRPLPERIGEPSVFRHVLYIIKENRTYDQVFGDIRNGRGDSSLCIFGEKVTPNQHRMANDFLLMDNFMVSGKCSAEGHQWTDASIVTDYVEKNVRAWFRSYPHVQEDALVYAPSGFLWDNARRHGVSVRIYGEASVPLMSDSLSWTSIYYDFLLGKPLQFRNHTTLNTVQPILCASYPSYDSHRIPDVLRAQTFIDELHHYEEMPGDSLPQLIMMALPNDHTAGTRPGFPTPRAMVADNDLALGQIMEALTKSRFWSNTVVFVVEDDSQDGWDHISSYRTTALVMSPYSRLQQTIHEPYNQPSMVRTIEQILGLPPMNIQDAIAVPMTACFGEKPDMRHYQALKNNIPLDEMNAPLSSLQGQSRHYAKLSMDPQFEHIDGGKDELMNRILWFSAKAETPYPSWLCGKGEGEGEDGD